jgi:hypothetical protein|tara:strand:- start:567 stop:1442 length:876 start_codon:yes stop_codon:yes gene_type:complete
MLPDDFDFAQLPPGATSTTLEEVGMLSSTIETIDYAITSWIKEDLDLSARTNHGYTEVPVFWQTPERAYQIKSRKELRDADGSLILPIVSIERVNIVKDPSRKGSFQAHTFSKNHNGRAGRMVIARKIKQDKTRNFAVATGTRTNNGGKLQNYFPRINKQVVIQTLSIPIPVYVNVEYKIVIKTEYQEQMNSLIQPFMTRTGQINSFLLRRNGHIYEAFLDQDFAHNNNMSDLSEDLRMFETSINLRVLGYLIGEGENDDRPIVTVEESVVEVTFPRESAVIPGEPSFLED